MTTRADIQNDRLIYTCNCGWIDLGHAGLMKAQQRRQPGVERPYASQKALWHQFMNESKLPPSVLDGNGVKVTYRQEMKGGIYVGETRSYWVRRYLSRAQKEQVAMAIFMEVSHAFEAMQASAPYRWVTDSGYSMEDLVSNLIGMYIVLRPELLPQFEHLCRPVSKEASLRIWDTYGGVGQTKNKNFTPIYRDDPECKSHPAPAFPKEFKQISPASKGNLAAAPGSYLFRDWTERDEFLSKPEPHRGGGRWY